MQKAVFPRSIYKRLISCCSKVVYNIILPFAYSEFTVQNQLLVGSFVGTTLRFYAWRAIFFLMHVLQNGQVWDDPTSVTHERFRRDFHYIKKKPSIAVNSGDGMQLFDRKFSKRASMHRGTFWRSWLKCSWILFIGKDVQKWRGKKLWRKNSSKTLQLDFYFIIIFFFVKLTLEW